MVSRTALTLEQMKQLPTHSPSGKSIVYYVPTKSGLAGVDIINIKTGEVRSAFPDELGDVELRQLPMSPEWQREVSSLEEAKYEREMAEKEAGYEEKRIREGKIKPEDVVLQRRGTKRRLEQRFKERPLQQQVPTTSAEYAASLMARQQQPTTRQEFTASLFERQAQLDIERRGGGQYEISEQGYIVAPESAQIDIGYLQSYAAQRRRAKLPTTEFKEEPPLKEFGGATYTADVKPLSFVDKLFRKSEKLEQQAQKTGGTKGQLLFLGAGATGFVGGVTEPVRHPVRFVKGMYQTVRHPVQSLSGLGTALQQSPGGTIGRLGGYAAFGKLSSKAVSTGIEKTGMFKKPTISQKATYIGRAKTEKGYFTGFEPEAKVTIGKRRYDVKGLGAEFTTDLGKGRYLDVGAIKYLIKGKGKPYKGVQTITATTKVKGEGYTGVMQYRTSLKLPGKKYAYESGIAGYKGKPYAYDPLGARYGYTQFIKRTRAGVTKDLTKTMRKDFMPLRQRAIKSRPSGLGAGLTRKMAVIDKQGVPFEYYQTISKEVVGKKPLSWYEKAMRQSQLFKDIPRPKYKGRPQTAGTSLIGLETQQITKPPTPLDLMFKQTARQAVRRIYGIETAKKAQPGLKAGTGAITTTSLSRLPMFDFEPQYFDTPPQAKKKGLFTIPSLKRISIVTPLSRSVSRQGTITRQKPLTESITGIDKMLGQQTRQRQVQRQIQGQQQIQKQQQLQRQKQIQRQVQRTKLITGFAVPPPIPPLVPPTTTTTLFPTIPKTTEEKKAKKKRRPRTIIGTYKPSILGIERFKQLGETIKKAPKVTAGLGLRPVTKAMERQAKQMQKSILGGM